jgi:hypothetical protein
MTASYDSGLGTTRDRARFLASDTNTDKARMSDEEWAWLLTENGDDPYLAAALGLERDAAKADDAGIAAKKVGDLSLQYEYGTRSDRLRGQAASLRRQARIDAGIVVKSSAHTPTGGHTGFTIGAQDNVR